MHSSGQQNFVMNRIETAWIMAEIKPYSFESMRNGSESEDLTMFTTAKMSAEEEIHRSMYASVVQARSEKGNKRKNVYAARRSRKP